MDFKIRIRTAFITALLVIGLLPLAGFTWFSYQRTLEREFDEVQDRHLLLAQNLSAALSRYEKDVRATIASVATMLADSRNNSGTSPMLEAMRIECVSIVDPTTGRIIAFVTGKTELAPEIANPELLKAAKIQGSRKGLRFLPAIQSKTGNFMPIVGRINGYLVIARMGTGYFQELGKQIAFGDQGHAAIVDQAGNVLAHPLPSWVAARKNISKISAVKRMMNGETGIEQFYSPALKGDMIAGLTSVRGPGWGVMIPQPVKELHAKAFENLKPIILGLLVAALVALALIKGFITWLAKPLENMTRHLQAQSKAGMPAAVPPATTNTSFYELQNIVQAYNELAMTVQDDARKLEELSVQDSVTGIGNRNYFQQAGTTQIGQRMALSKRGVLIFVDLDGFKEINDTQGHAVGDAYLQAFAKGLYPATKRFMDREFRGVVGAHPIIGRIGGDEFAILLPIPDAIDDVRVLCERLRLELPNSVSVNGISIPCGSSSGGATYPEHGTAIEDLLRRADVALYLAKANGKGRFEIYNPKHALGGKSEILAAVKTAIEDDQLVLEYQPKYCLTKNRVTSVEALVRWKHPTLGQIPPNMFLPAIQQTHAMENLGDWVVRRAIRDMQAMDASGFHLNVAVNIGAEHFSAPSFSKQLKKQCADAGFAPSRLQVEVTEDVMGASREAFSRTVQAVQEQGFTVAIDDFGKGFSNLSRLASIPVDVIKIDRSLVSEAVGSPRLHTIMASVISMSHSLGSAVIVEGVETQAEVAMATAAGADGLQGYHFSRPLPLENLKAWLREQSCTPQHRQLETVRKALLAA
ncbi:EAL domain-containing protein [Ahrensia sp. R2A130]|uniref:bifunctional diguanylate cyclase/phosphodiesterase n=1 Tax=Ahrensia sp. R2A130 TaxID=744979 RepID=UPI0001E0A487|nr:EAL domain-containing protein [Ahrensia sp. R2A130]EFL88614.1 ggdef/eal/pas-domain-containing protein [Ahrensia sp. R2A130]